MNRKVALVTGASSGIGRDISIILSKKGYELILVARRENRLTELQSELKTNSEIIVADLSNAEECFELYEKLKKSDISVVINCAGFGILGEFENIPLERELEMLDVNVKAVHILTKLFIKNFSEKNHGYLLNVASTAGLMPGGPLMAAYYATKAYVTSLTIAINQELKSAGSQVYIGALCPGPVDTEFNQVANASFSVQSISSYNCAKYAVRKMFKKKMLIVPSFYNRLLVFGSRFISKKLTLMLTEQIQKIKS